jgi:antitoxin (DNA-binding transcriptional repressor) of toxin-antitoxin stability system
MKTASIQEVKDHLSQFVRLAEAGEEVLLTRHGIVVARIVGCTPPRQLGWMKGTISGDTDFSEHPDLATSEFLTDNVFPQ